MSKRISGSIKSLKPEQRELLQALVPDGAPLRSLRQLGWPLNKQDVLHLQEHFLSQAAGQITQVRGCAAPRRRPALRCAGGLR